MTTRGPSDEARLARRLARITEAIATSADPLRDPLDMRFRPFPAERQLEAWERLTTLAKEGRLHDELVLYVHIPFCARVCSYCLLASRKSGGRARIVRYLEALDCEMDLLAPRVAGLPVRTVHIGGGTPTLLTAAELDALLRRIRSRFDCAPDLAIGVEAHPTTATADKMAALARNGVGRVSFGVETFTPEVLAAVERSDQTDARVERAIFAARDAGIAEVNVDLLAGLPGETVATFEHSVVRALALAPDSMSVNRYLAEGSPLAYYGYAPDGETDRLADAMLVAADRVVRAERPPTHPREPLAAPGFGTQYVWDAAGGARAYYQQDMIGPASVLTLGHGVLGHLHGGSFYTSGAGLDAWMDALLTGEPPPVRARPLGMRFERAHYFADRACRGAFDPDAFRRIFRMTPERAFGPEIAFLEARGLLVEDAPGRYRKPPSASFQVTHLLAFLWLDGDDATEEAARATDGDAAARAPAPATDGTRRLRVLADDVPAAVERIAALPRGDGVLALELGRILGAQEAVALRAAAERTGRTIEVDAPTTAPVLAQYGRVGSELSPSVLWCRIAMAAARAAREGEAIG